MLVIRRLQLAADNIIIRAKMLKWEHKHFYKIGDLISDLTKVELMKFEDNKIEPTFAPKNEKH